MKCLTVSVHLTTWLGFVALLPVPVTAAEPSDPAPQAIAENIAEQAMALNPAVRAARARALRLFALHDGVSGFFDPRLSAAAGRNDSPSDVPETRRGVGLGDDSISARLGVEFAALPGMYVNLGVSEQRLLEPDDPYDELYRTTAGGSLWIPVGRDRLFREWRERDTRAWATALSASNDFVAVSQDVRRQVERLLISLMQSHAELDVVETALVRVNRLLDEARELIRLRVVPQYQVFAAQLEVDLYRAEKESAEQRMDALRIDLGELVGHSEALEVATGPAMLLQWATNLPPPRAIEPEDAREHRGVYVAARERLRAAQADMRLLAEAVKPDIAVTASATWRGDDPDSPFKRSASAAEDQDGYEVAVVWTQPLGHRTENAELRAARHLVNALEHELASTALRIAAQLENAESSLASAHRRMSLVTDAVEAARRALVAEEERFRLGEGRSRNVLDAQKDLTAAVRRRNLAAADLLGAYADWRFATGYADIHPPALHIHDTKGQKQP